VLGLGEVKRKIIELIEYAVRTFHRKKLLNRRCRANMNRSPPCLNINHPYNFYIRTVYFQRYS
jgi:hypothetical protein